MGIFTYRKLANDSLYLKDKDWAEEFIRYVSETMKGCPFRVTVKGSCSRQPGLVAKGFVAASAALLISCDSSATKPSDQAPQPPSSPTSASDSATDSTEMVSDGLPPRTERDWVLVREIERPIQVYMTEPLRATGNAKLTEGGWAFRGGDDALVLDNLKIVSAPIYLRLEMFPFFGDCVILDAGTPETGGFGLYLEDWELKLAWRVPGKEPEHLILGPVEKGKRAELILEINRGNRVLTGSLNNEAIPSRQRVSSFFSGPEGGTKLTIANDGGDPLVDGRRPYAFQGVILALYLANTDKMANVRHRSNVLYGAAVLTQPPEDGARFVRSNELLGEYTFADGSGVAARSPEGVELSPLKADSGLEIDTGFTHQEYGDANPVLRVRRAEESDLSGAIEQNDYFEFTITPSDRMSLLRLSLDAFKGGPQARGFGVYSSVEGFEVGKEVLVVEPDALLVRKSPGQPFAAELNPSLYTDLSDTVAFRFYVHTGDAGRSVEFDNITLSGRVSQQTQTESAAQAPPSPDSPVLKTRQITENFGSDPAARGWVGSGNEGPSDGFGFRDSNLAEHRSGPGEIGGEFDNDAFSFYAHRSPRLKLSEAALLECSGRLFITKPSPTVNEDIVIGHIHTEKRNKDGMPHGIYLCLREPLDEPNAAHPNFRAELKITTEDRTVTLSMPGGVNLDQSYHFSYRFDPDAGEIQFKVGPKIETQPIPEGLTFESSAFGLAAKHRKAVDGHQLEAYFDGLIYSIAE